MAIVDVIKKASMMRKGSSAIDEIFRRYKNAPPQVERESWKSGAKTYYDLTPSCENNRKRAVLNYTQEAKKRLHGVISDPQIEAYLTFTNTLICRGGYNASVDFLNLTTLSAAIWILDNLALNNKLEQIYPLLPKIKDKFPEDLLVPPVNHPIYEEELVLALVQLIRHRNTAKDIEEITGGTLVWENGKESRRAEAESYRVAFDSIIQMLNPEDVKKAISRYEEDVWRFYRIAFAIYGKVEAEVTRLEKELEQLQNQLVPSMNSFVQNKNPLLVNAPKKPEDLLLSNARRSDIEQRIGFIESKIDWYQTKITFTDLALVNDRERTMKWLSGIIPKSLQRELIEFHVNDPYESAFALLYLLDSGSLIPWLYYGSISVAYTMYDQLPFDSEDRFTKEPILLSEWNNALYQHRYKGYRWEDRTDAQGEPVQRTNAKNLSQLLYANAQTMFPRVVPAQPMLNSYLEELGDLSDREKEAYSLLLFMMNAASLHFDGNDIEEIAKDAETSNQTEERDAIDQSALLLENDRLRKKNQELALALRGLKQQKKLADSNLAAIKTELSEKGQELADLRELVFLLDNKDIQEEPVDETIQYPFITPGKILSFGGHPSWIKEMKKKLPNVVFVGPDTLPNADLIRSADTIWIQTNCLSHSDFYKICSVVGASGKQLRYFTSSSSAKCAEQVVKSIKARD